MSHWDWNISVRKVRRRHHTAWVRDWLANPRRIPDVPRGRKLICMVLSSQLTPSRAGQKQRNKSMCATRAQKRLQIKLFVFKFQSALPRAALGCIPLHFLFTFALRQAIKQRRPLCVCVSSFICSGPRQKVCARDSLPRGLKGIKTTMAIFARKKTAKWKRT